jgi:hypothetical protein
MLLSIGNACLANINDFSRTAKFTSPEEFVKVARNFRPASERSEFSYFFSAPERGNDDSTCGKLVFAEAMGDVTELWRGPDLCAYFLQTSPKTEYTRSYVAALLLLERSIDSGIWRITTVERFQATGAGGGIHCRVLRQPEKSAPLTFRITETDAGRRDVSEERAYTVRDLIRGQVVSVLFRKTALTLAV